MFLAIRDLRFARGRFVLMGAVIALIATLTVLLSGLATGLVDDGISALRGMPATHLAFQPNSQGTFSRSTVDAEQWRSWANVEGLQATPLGNTLFNGRTEDGVAVDIALLGIDPEGWLVPDVLEGDAAGGDPEGIVVSRGLVDDGIAIGDSVTLAGSDMTVTVVGISDEASYGHIPVAWGTLELWQRANYTQLGGGDLPAGADSLASAVVIRDDPDLAADVDLDQMDDLIGTETLTKTEAYDGSPGYSAETSTMNLIRGFLYLISGLLVGAFFTVWTIQRKHQIGLLKAVGASNWWVLRDALGQVLIVLVAATVAGVILGLGLGSLVGSDVPFSLEPGPVMVAAMLLIAMGMLGSLVAVRRITRIDPLIALGGER